MKKYVHVIAGLSLALAVTGCANEGDSVVSQAAAVAVQRSQDEGKQVSSVAAALAQIKAATGPVTVSFNNASSAPISLTENDLNEIVNAVKAATQNVTLDFTGTTIPGNEVPPRAFENAAKLSGITLPSGITKINQRAFKNTGLTAINLPGTLTSISNYVFEGCASLNSVTLPSNLTSIGENAFTGTGLTSVTIPASVTELKSNAFSGCSSLTSVTYGGTADQFKTAIGSNATTIFPATVKKVKCTPGVLYLVNSDWLVPSEYGNTVINAIEGQAADYVTGANKIQITQTLTDADRGIIRTLLAADSSTKKVYLDMASLLGLTIVPTNEFKDCTKLVGIDLPATIHSIGSNAFQGCTALTSITIPATVNGATAIGNYAFANCNSLTSVTYGGTADQFKTAIDTYKTTIFPATLKKATCSDGTLYYACTSGPSAAVTYDWLVPSSDEVKTFIVAINNQSDDYDATSNPAKISFTSAVTLTMNDLYIIKALLSGTNQKKVYLDFTNATFPNGITDTTVSAIPVVAFSWCAKLAGITLPASLKKIEIRAFSGCTNLKTVTIGNNSSIPALATIDDYIFESCSALTTVNYWGTAADWSSITKYYSTGITNVTLNVNDGSNNLIPNGNF